MNQINRKSIFKATAVAAIGGSMLLGGCAGEKKKVEKKPNFLILMSDNHSWNHVGCYGDPVVKTPNIDKLAKQGVRFTNTYCSSPSCSPARASMLTGKQIWELGECANLWGTFPKKYDVYPDILEKSGYHVGIEGKGWGPGDVEASGRDRNPGGDRYSSFEEFYNEIDKGQPFCYWYSSRDPHRPFKRNGGKKAGIDLSKIVVPSYLPDTKEVRGDISDYYAEIQSFDREVGSYLQLLKEMGKLENTVVIICSDNGWQMPRGLANLYTMGTKVPLIVHMPKRFKGNRVVDDFITLNDFAPTILELAGAKVPESMSATSFVDILKSEKSGIIDPKRDFVVTARERHAFARKGGPGYPGRAIQTKDFIYIQNIKPELWPAGDPPLYGDVDAHMLQYPCPTKMYMLENAKKEGVSKLFDLSFAKRDAEELYDLNKDPDQMNNLAYDKNYAKIKKEIKAKMLAHQKATKDPRAVGGNMLWDNAKYFAEKDKTPRPGMKAQKALGLEEEYSYVD